MFMLTSVTLTIVLVKNYETLRKIKRAILQKEDVLIKRRELQFLADLDKGEGISEEQFILAILQHIGTVDREKDVMPWVEVRIDFPFILQQINSFFFEY